MLEGVPVSLRAASTRRWFTSPGTRVMLLCFQDQILPYSMKDFLMSPGRKGSECGAVLRTLPTFLTCKAFKRNSRMKTSHSHKVLAVPWRQTSQNSQLLRSISLTLLLYWCIVLQSWLVLIYTGMKSDLRFDSGLDKKWLMLSIEKGRSCVCNCFAMNIDLYWTYLN